MRMLVAHILLRSSKLTSESSLALAELGLRFALQYTRRASVNHSLQQIQTLQSNITRVQTG